MKIVPYRRPNDAWGRGALNRPKKCHVLFEWPLKLRRAGLLIWLGIFLLVKILLKGNGYNS